MASRQRCLLLLLVLLLSLFALSASLTCSTQKHSGNKLYSKCVDLPTLDSYLHWTYNPSNATLSIAFLAPPPSSSGWISWAINPTATGMAGSQALIASTALDGSVTVETYNIKSYGSIVEGGLDFQVYEKTAEYSDGMMKIYATLAVPHTLSASGNINHVWQVGPSMIGGIPSPHDFKQANLQSMGTLNLTSGIPTVAPHGDFDKRAQLKTVHGVLNAISWGILFPLGVIIARYLRTFESADPAWFYLHISCQMLGYALGVAGWATGLKLGSQSNGIVYSAHRAIGIVLFCFATNQIFAMLVRPKKDHKYRVYWNIYHRSVGYAIVILGIVNVFEGFDILQPQKMWKTLYIVVVVVLGCVAVVLEAVTWAVVILRKKAVLVENSNSEPEV